MNQTSTQTNQNHLVTAERHIVSLIRESYFSTFIESLRIYCHSATAQGVLRITIAFLKELGDGDFERELREGAGFRELQDDGVCRSVVDEMLCFRV